MVRNFGGGLQNIGFGTTKAKHLRKVGKHLPKLLRVLFQ